MNKEIKAKWIAALRGGKYRQGREQLRKGGRFCCLGVLCNIHAQENPILAATQDNQEWYFGSKIFLANRLMRWSGVSRVTQVVLSDMNDGTYGKPASFKEIASYIKKNL
jgi:hypothetical protein